MGANTPQKIILFIAACVIILGLYQCGTLTHELYSATFAALLVSLGCVLLLCVSGDKTIERIKKLEEEIEKLKEH